ncbi:MAG: GTPase domain-containing protein, partial [Planctomycetes bacterium]|nr:GTPase domain-containing protein [Planctomycetota bacterium]
MPSADAAFLPERWQGLGCFLGRELALVSAAAREAALREWRDVTEAERAIDDRLAVGLVGGTGVGKSTLVNALAGAEISATGERRPTTSRVVAYRHARTRLPEALPRADIADPEVVHGTDALERVVILDFPDFDSVEELHHEVLERFCPHLDVLIVLVDDMKYADARLFELLRRLPQARENLRPVLNKVDRLDRRYAGRWRAVAGEILDDLHAKLEAHAGIRVPREGMLAISAWNAFLAASPGSAGSADSGASAGSGPAACGAGDFPELVRFLHDYRQEKRRRAAKELNLEARKRALARRLAAEALAPEAAERVERGAARLEERSAELRRALAGTPAALFTRDERRRIASASLVRAAGRLGFPVDFLVTLAGHLRLRSRERRAARVAVTPARVCEHYRAYLDAAENAVREAALDLGD